MEDINVFDWGGGTILSMKRGVIKKGGNTYAECITTLRDATSWPAFCLTTQQLHLAFGKILSIVLESHEVAIKSSINKNKKNIYIYMNSINNFVVILFSLVPLHARRALEIRHLRQGSEIIRRRELFYIIHYCLDLRCLFFNFMIYFY